MEFSHPWNNPIPIPFLPRNPALTSVRVAADSFSSSPFAASQCSAIEVKSYKRSKRTGRHARETEWGTVFVGRNKPALFQPDPNIEMGVDPERTPELKRNLKTRGGGKKMGRRGRHSTRPGWLLFRSLSVSIQPQPGHHSRLPFCRS